MTTSATELLVGARALLNSPASTTGHRRGSCFLARQAMEAAVRAALGPFDRRDLRWRTRFVVLRLVTGAPAARHGHQLWAQWSDWCHYHPYELVPNTTELLEHLRVTERWVNAAARPRGRR